MKNNKISLAELKVKSFVTNIDKGVSQTAKGGVINQSIIICYSDFCDSLATCVTDAIQGCPQKEK